MVLNLNLKKKKLDGWGWRESVRVFKNTFILTQTFRKQQQQDFARLTRSKFHRRKHLTYNSNPTILGPHFLPLAYYSQIEVTKSNWKQICLYKRLNLLSQTSPRIYKSAQDICTMLQVMPSDEKKSRWGSGSSRWVESGQKHMVG